MVLGWVLAWSLLGLAHLMAQLGAGLPVQARSLPLYLAYELGHFVVLGVLTGACVGMLVAALRTVPQAELIALALLSLALGFALVRPGVTNLATQMGGAYGVSPGLLIGLTTVGAGLFIPLAWWVGRSLARWPAAFWGLLGLVIIGALFNRSILRRGNPAAHLFIAWAAASPLAAYLSRSLGRPRRRPVRARHLSVVMVGALLAIPTLFVPPGNDIRVALAASSGSVLFPYVTPLYRSLSSSETLVPHATDDPWLTRRPEGPGIPPTSDVPRPEHPVVVLITVDAMRADILERPELAASLPHMMAFHDASVVFSQARSPGSQTVYTLAMVFATRYYSQLYWTALPNSRIRDVWPHEDETPRFPEILQSAGVRTTTVLPTFWLADQFGIARGFDDSTFEALGESVSRAGASHWNGAARVLEEALDAIEAISDDESRFIYVHFVDPHEPYDDAPGAEGGFDGYLLELAEVDRALGVLLEELARPGLSDRVTVIITSDHGEAFGEHDAYFHATTLYDELLRVPLMVRGPGLAPHLNLTPVSLMDLGPTILDLFDVQTPGFAMGESLFPLLLGRETRPTRPIAAEGRRMRSMVFPDGVKVIVDLRADTVEVYDLGADPEELENLAGNDDFDARVAYVHSFFEVHALRRDGYELPDRH